MHVCGCTRVLCCLTFDPSQDLEVAADLHIAVSHKDLLQCLYDSHHAQVAIAGRMDRGKMMFVPFELAKAVDNKE